MKYLFVRDSLGEILVLNDGGVTAHLGLSDRPLRYDVSVANRALEIRFEYVQPVLERTKTVCVGNAHAEIAERSGRLMSLRVQIPDRVSETASSQIQQDLRLLLQSLKEASPKAGRKLNYMAAGTGLALNSEVVPPWMQDALSALRTQQDT